MYAAVIKCSSGIYVPEEQMPYKCELKSCED